MKVLIAEDELFTRKMLESLLSKWGYEIVIAHDGKEALKILTSPDPPRLALLDWLMPELDGAEVCRRFRNRSGSGLTYLVLLTSKGRREDIIEGFAAGADDYISKPFDHEVLKARLLVGRRMVELQISLSTRLEELQAAMEHIKLLQGILPICSYCKKIRDDSQYWQQLETYFSKHSDIRFSHGVCPDCFEKYVQPELDKLEKKQKNKKEKPKK